MQKEKYPLLNKINSPADLKAMPESDMGALCLEIRRFLVENVKNTGGHLASNLGVVELTVALHRVFDSPTDKFIFDVGHQSYVHKLLTGRRECFPTLRQAGGMSGFTKRAESEHDPFGAGHSSTSVSAALGFAAADKLSGKDGFSIAILGDGAFTGGMVHEALNNCSPDLKLIIILNENEMSISKNIGGFANYMAKIRASRGYNKAKRRTKSLLNAFPKAIGKPLYNVARDTKQFIKNTLYSSNYFEELGLFYLGPCDGNDYESVSRMLLDAKEKGESAIVHIKTKKGKGYLPAEQEPNKYHGILPRGKSECYNFSRAMGEHLCALSEKDERICAITAAMCESTGLLPFKEAYPKRFFDVGIAEEHALAFSAALAADGMRPFFAVYSSFLQRGYDNIIHDIAMQNLPVSIMIDRGALAAGDGPTHHGIYDVSMLGAANNFTLYAPMSFATLKLAMEESLSLSSPSAVRYPNSSEIPEIMGAFDFSSLDIKTSYPDGETPSTLIITYGKIAAEALKAKEELARDGIRAGVVLLEKLMPYSDVAPRLAEIISGAEHIIFLEEGIRAGGFGMMMSDALRARHPEAVAKAGIDILAIDSGFCGGERGVALTESFHISSKDIISLCKK